MKKVQNKGYVNLSYTYHGVYIHNKSIAALGLYDLAIRLAPKEGLRMDLYRLLGRIVIACIITSVIAIPLMFLFLKLTEKNHL